MTAVIDAERPEIEPASGRGELRRRILDHATRLFARKGFSGTSVRELAVACRCTKPALYYYFDSKETLFRQVVQRHLEDIHRMIQAWTESPGEVRDGIHRSLDSFLDYARTHSEAMRLLQRIETRPELGAPAFNTKAARELHLDMVSGLIERGIAQGEIRASVVPLDCALVIAGTVSHQFELALATGQWDRRRLHRTIDLIFDGIAP